MKLKKRVLGIVAALTLSSVFGGTYYNYRIQLAKQAVSSVKEATAKSKKNTKEKYKVERVVDGDTFVIKKSGKLIKVRLIGVDTPESVHKNKKRNTIWGKKASAYTKRCLLKKKVYLTYDISKKDKYGRLLAYVWTKKSGKYIMFNQTLVKKGYARAVCYEPNHKYKATFNKLQKDAKLNKRGFWRGGYNKAFSK